MTGATDAPPAANRTRRVDGLVFHFDGWSDDLGQSGLSALHVTAAGSLSDFDDVVNATLACRQRIRAAGDRMFPIEDVAGLDRVGIGDDVGIILGLQNAGCLAEDVGRVEQLWDLGIRVIQPAYNDANGLADGCLEDRNAGLTKAGRAVVRDCNRLGILLDISHLGVRSSLEVVEASTAPVLVTHANRRALANNPRNKEDALLREVAAAGGVIGVSVWGPMCWNGDPAHRPTVKDFLAQLSTMIDLVGDERVGVSTDLPAILDGGPGPGVTTILRQSLERYPGVIGAFASAFGNQISTRYCEGFERLAKWSDLDTMLEESGYSPETIDKVLGENWLAAYRGAWDLRKR